jgi:hypothetical protein
VLGIARKEPPILRVIAASDEARARLHRPPRRASVLVAPATLLVALLVAMLVGAASARAEVLPAVTTGNASELGLTHVTLSGTIETASPVQECWFEWGVPPHFEESVPCRGGSGQAGVVAAEAQAGELASGTTYGWRLAAVNAAGVAHGLTGSFTTNGYPLAASPPASESLTGDAFGPAPAPTPALKAAHGHFEDGLYIAYCPATGVLARHEPRAASAMADHTGWPALQCLKMDKGTYGLSHTLIGQADVHNFLLGGYGNDTIWGGEAGDVIWGDYQPSGQSRRERDWIHAGNGTDWIYSSHGRNEIWTGAGDDHVALVYGWGTVHCNGPGTKTLVMRLLPRNRHWHLIGCRRRKIVPYKA